MEEKRPHALEVDKKEKKETKEKNEEKSRRTLAQVSCQNTYVIEESSIDAEELLKLIKRTPANKQVVVQNILLLELLKKMR